MSAKWQNISFVYDSQLENAISQQHLAVQLIALVGRYLLIQKPDQSNINMVYLPEQKMLLGNRFNKGWQLGLFLPGLELHLFSDLISVKKIKLNGKTFKQAFGELSLILIEAGIDISLLKNEQPYPLPALSLSAHTFSKNNQISLQAATDLRHNADVVINQIAAEFKDAVPVRIWPHHFDTGTYFALARNAAGAVSSTIGLGWTIQDEMINEPYFYLSFWSEHKINSTSQPQNLQKGSWMTPNWNGAVLRHSDIIHEETAKKQLQMVKHFFHEGVSILSNILKNRF